MYSSDHHYVPTAYHHSAESHITASFYVAGS